MMGSIRGCVVERRASPLATILAAMWVCALVVAGCGRSPDVSHYMLGTARDSAIAEGAPDVAVLVGPVRLPRYLERPQIARRQRGGEIEFDEFSRWLGGFEANLTNALAADLRRRLGSVRVVGYPSSPPFAVDYDVRIHVDEWIVDETNTLRVEVRYALSNRGSKASPILDVHSADIAVNGRSTEALVAAHDRALSEFGAHLADQLAVAATALGDRN